MRIAISFRLLEHPFQYRREFVCVVERVHVFASIAVFGQYGFGCEVDDIDRGSFRKQCGCE